ncbi:MAG: CCA tRNA nucleotidyltransferase [Alphaproteobacteria bacterium]|nr:CCA tRNA nucleotidyltransferase [Alphaproteobacteria bacterium]
MKIKPSFFKRQGVQKLFDVFDEGTLYVVGGAVRDCLIKRPVKDVDFATSLKPREAVALLEKSNIRAIPTGLQHGTITAIIRKQSYEITTFRQDVETDGRHAKVAFVSSLEEDSKRRDFTLNALYLNNKGEIFDFVGGLEDLKQKQVRFIGDANSRIKEDALRILRFFRFSALFDKPLDSQGLKSCISHKGLLKNISRERIYHELLTLFTMPFSENVLDVIFREKILDSVIWSKENYNVLCHENASPFQKLLCLFSDVSEIFPLSNREKKRVNIVRQYVDESLYEILYFYGKESAEDIWFWNRYQAKQSVFSREEVDQIFPLPEFPVSGQDLLSLGYQGKVLGNKMKALKETWLKSKCQMTRKKLLS